MEFDHRHRIVGSLVWDLPNMQTDSGVLKRILHGWQVSGNGQYQSGGPYTVRSGRDNSQTGIGRDRAKLTGVSIDPPAGSDKTVWFNPAAFALNDVGTFGTVGTGALYGPHLFGFDMTAARFEKHSVSLPAEMSEGVRSRVGTRGFSAYVAQAVARQLERDALDDVLARMESEHGPVDEDEVLAIM